MNNFLHIKTKIVQGWKNKETGLNGEPRIQYLNFGLLQDVINTMAKKLCIQLDIKEIEDEKIELINSLLKNHSGNNNLSFQVFDNEEKIMVDMDSQKQKINISSDLLSKLDDNKILYKLN